MTMRAAGWLTAGLLAALAGCGGDSTLLRDADALGLKEDLEQVRAAVDARDCSRAETRLRQLQSRVGNLGGSVDRGLRRRLREEINGKLAPAVEQECDEDRTETLPTTTSPGPTGPTAPLPEPEPAPAPEPEAPPATVPEPDPEVPSVPDPPTTQPSVPEIPPPDPGDGTGGIPGDGDEGG